MRLLIVRHGQSIANRDRLVLGRSTQVPLTELGREQARAAADRVACLVLGRSQVLSSDALRARQTAEPIAARLGVDVGVTELLAEQSLGELEGRPTAELVALPVPAGRHINDIAWGGGESIAMVHRRMRRLVDLLWATSGQFDWRVLVGHGDALCVLQAVFAGRGHREIDWVTDRLDHGEVRVVIVGREPPGWQIA